MSEQFYKIQGFSGSTPAGGPGVPFSGMTPGLPFAAKAADAKLISGGGIAAFDSFVATHYPASVAPYYAALPPTSFHIQQWSPLDISLPLRIWLDSTAIPLPAGAQVQAWDDLSGNGYQLTQDSLINSPIYDDVQFNGCCHYATSGNIDPNSRWLSDTSFAAANIMTMFVVLRFDGTMGGAFLTASDFLSDTSPPTPRLRLGPDGATYNVQVATGPPPLSGSVWDNFTHVISCDYSPAAVNLYRDGVLDASAVMFTIGMGGIAVGTDPSLLGNYSWDGLIGSIIIVGGVCSTEERTLVQTYLAQLHSTPADPIVL